MDNAAQPPSQKALNGCEYLKPPGSVVVPVDLPNVVHRNQYMGICELQQGLESCIKCGSMMEAAMGRMRHM